MILESEGRGLQTVPCPLERITSGPSVNTLRLTFWPRATSLNHSFPAPNLASTKRSRASASRDRRSVAASRASFPAAPAHRRVRASMNRRRRSTSNGFSILGKREAARPSMASAE